MSRLRVTRRRRRARISWFSSLHLSLVDRRRIDALVTCLCTIPAEALGHQRFGGEIARRVSGHGRQELVTAKREGVQLLEGGDCRCTGQITKQGDLAEAVARTKRRAWRAPDSNRC